MGSSSLGAPPRKRWWLVVLLLVVLLPGVLGGLLCAGGFGLQGALREVVTEAADIELPETRPVPGSASRFDPIASLDEISAWAGDGAVLVGLRVEQVRLDGSVPLDAEWTPKPSVEYEFWLKAEAPEVAPPVGAGGGGDEWWREVTVRAFEPGQSRQVSSSGRVNVRHSYTNEGMVRERGSVARRVAKPLMDVRSCPPKRLWELARAEGFPIDAVASIRYEDDGARFSIDGTKHDLRVDARCEMKRKRSRRSQ